MPKPEHTASADSVSPGSHRLIFLSVCLVIGTIVCTGCSNSTAPDATQSASQADDPAEAAVHDSVATTSDRAESEPTDSQTAPALDVSSVTTEATNTSSTVDADLSSGVVQAANKIENAAGSQPAENSIERIRPEETEVIEE